MESSSPLIIALLGITQYQPARTEVPWAPEAQREEPESIHLHALRRALPSAILWLVGTAKARQKNAGVVKHDRFIEIPKGECDAEFWDIFECIAQALAKHAATVGEAGCDLHLDLTFGYRVQPMFLLEAVRYAQNLHPRLRLVRAYYHNVVDSDHGVLRVVSPILELQQVAQEVQLLLSHSVVEPLSKRIGMLSERRKAACQSAARAAPEAVSLADGELKRYLSEAWRQDPLKHPLENMEKLLSSFGALVGLNHTPLAARLVRQLCARAQAFARATQGYAEFQALSRALMHLEQELSQLLPRDDKPLWGWHQALARWCLERGLYQQALTHAEEMITTRLCEENGQEPLDNKGARAALGGTLKSWDRQGGVPHDWSEIIKACDSVIEKRNNVNHAFLNTQSLNTLKRLGTEPDKINKTLEQVGKGVKEAVENLLRQNAALARLPALADPAGRPKRAFVLTSHTVQAEQERQLRDYWQASGLVSLPEALQAQWSQVPPDLTQLKDYAKPLLEWLGEQSAPGDLVWVQGEYGMVDRVVDWCRAKGRTALYATTVRAASEQATSDGLLLTHKVSHQRFRKYGD